MKEYKEWKNTCFHVNGFREILLNSINHKQYEESNPIQVSIYEDKIYVWNDGKFPEELASQNLFEKHYSKPYNPLIAQTFFKAGFIESWGRGFEKIKKECEQYKTPIPEIEIKTSGVMVKCNPSKLYMNLLNEIIRKNVQINVPKNVQINVQIKENEKLTKTEKQILDIISENPQITQVNMAKILKITPKTVQRGITTLKEKGIIERVGANKKGYWKLN